MCECVFGSRYYPPPCIPPLQRDLVAGRTVQEGDGDVKDVPEVVARVLFKPLPQRRREGGGGRAKTHPLRVAPPHTGGYKFEEREIRWGSSSSIHPAIGPSIHIPPRVGGMGAKTLKRSPVGALPRRHAQLVEGTRPVVLSPRAPARLPLTTGVGMHGFIRQDCTKASRRLFAICAGSHFLLCSLFVRRLSFRAGDY